MTEMAQIFLLWCQVYSYLCRLLLTCIYTIFYQYYCSYYVYIVFVILHLVGAQ